MMVSPFLAHMSTVLWLSYCDCPVSVLHSPQFVVPRLFEEKWRDTVFGFPWGVACGAWRVVRGSEFLVGTLSP